MTDATAPVINNASYLDCFNELINYSRYFSNHPPPITAETRLPHPLAWTKPSCQGQLILPYDENNQVSKTFAVAQSIGSLYVPPGWKVTVTSNNVSKVFDARNTTYSILRPDLSIERFDSTTTPIKTISSLSSTLATDQMKALVNMCMGRSSPTIGTSYIQSFLSGSSECDEIMTQFCTANPTSDDCVCLSDEAALINQYCQPGNTNPNCPTNQPIVAFVPVACFGRECSSHGYRWARMRNQNCNLKICEQMVDIVGSNNIIGGKSELWCGNKPLDAYTTSGSGSTGSGTGTGSPTGSGGITTVTVTTTTPLYIELQGWVWIFIAGLIIFTCVILPMVYFTLRHRISQLFKSWT